MNQTPPPQKRTFGDFMFRERHSAERSVASYDRTRRHKVIYGNSLDLTINTPLADIAFLDPPGLSREPELRASQGWSSYEVFVQDAWNMLDRRLKPDAGVVFVSREAKGTGFVKGPIWVYWAQKLGWEIPRVLVWRYSSTDDVEYHRSAGAFTIIYTFRRGTMPMQSAETSPWRFKDIVRVEGVEGADGVSHIPRNSNTIEGDLSVPLTEACLRFFCPQDPERIVLDPFMGSSQTAKAAQSFGIQSIGFELHPERYIDMVKAFFTERDPDDYVLGQS